MNRHPNTAWSDQCLLYLLGELPADELPEFQNKLREHESLGDELALMAEMLHRVAEVKTDLPSVTLRQPNHVSLSRPSNGWRWGLAAMTLAASVMFAFIIGNPLRDRSDDASNPQPLSNEVTLVAQAWVQSESTFEFNNDRLPEFATGDFALESSEEIFSAEADGVEDDSTLAWLVAGIDAGEQIDG